MKILTKIDTVKGGIMHPKHYTEESWHAHYLWGLEHPGLIGPPKTPFLPENIN